MDINRHIKKRVFWWVIGSLGAVGIGIVLLVLILSSALLGILISSSDTSSMTHIPVPDHPAFDIPAPLLPIYIQAENERASWARLAAIHKITTDFGAKCAKRMDTIGGLGFPRSLWETYKVDGDGDGKIEADNPYDAIFSLANYLNVSALSADESLEAWFLNRDDVNRVFAKEAEYLAALVIPRQWLWPVIGYTRISSTYGYRIDPITGAQGAFHAGIDIPAPTGTPIVAIQNGMVVQVTWSNKGYGNAIRIMHEDGHQSLYAHLVDIGVRRDQKVGRGEVIGWVGSTGRSTGPHLHLEILKNGQTVDPLPYFSEENN